jgi:hypothetical protein
VVLVQRLGHVQGHELEADARAGPQLAQQVEVGADDVGQPGIAADGLAVHAEYDRQAVARHLHRTRTDRLGGQLARRHDQRRTLQSEAHAVALRCDGVGISRARHVVRMAARQHAQGDHLLRGR